MVSDPVARYRMPCEALQHLLREALSSVLLRTRCDCIALSGGVDTALIAALANYLGLELRGYTVIYAGGLPRDLPYVNYLEKKLGMRVDYVILKDSDIVRRAELLKEVLKNSPVADPVIEMRNDVVFHAALEKALKDGCECVYTGSGGDEVFVGYRFMIYERERELEALTLRYALRGYYPELAIGRLLGVEVVAPYLTDEVLRVALRIPIDCLRGYSMTGKEILRSILKSLGLDYVALRTKTPAEAGAGTDVINSLP